MDESRRKKIARRATTYHALIEFYETGLSVIVDDENSFYHNGMYVVFP